MNVWPFLISRNKQLGFRVIVAPQFLNERGRSSILLESAAGSLTLPGRAFYCEIHGSVGSLSLIFQVVRAERRLLEAGEETLLRDEPDQETLLRDEHGRPINLIEGIVLWGKHPDVFVCKEDLQFAHDRVVPAYREFWKTREEVFATQSSTCFSLHQDTVASEKLSLIIEMPVILNIAIQPPFEQERPKPPVTSDVRSKNEKPEIIHDDPKNPLPPSEKRPEPPIQPGGLTPKQELEPPKGRMAAKSGITISWLNIVFLVVILALMLILVFTLFMHAH